MIIKSFKKFIAAGFVLCCLAGTHGSASDETLTAETPVFSRGGLTANAGVTCSSTVTNTGLEQDVYLISALYRNDLLEDIKIRNELVNAGETDKPISVRTVLPADVENCYLKAVVWSEDVAPLTLSAELFPSPGSKYFSMATSGESMGDHVQLYPELRAAGVSVMRAWPEWGGIMNKYGNFNWNDCDAILASAKSNNIEITGILCYLPNWASSVNKDRTFPMSEEGREAYKNYVRASFTRYKDDVKYWEVYNEYNSDAFAKDAAGGFGKAEDYVKMVVDAYNIAQEINETYGSDIKIGIGCADVAVSFFTSVINGGAYGHFDFIAVHPYSLMDAAIAGRESSFLSLSRNLRIMLKNCGYENPEEIPLWITEMGVTTNSTTVNVENDKRQAEALIKAYVLPLAQGFEKMYWFEGRGPDYGNGMDFGIIRTNWTKRASYFSLKTMTELLGEVPVTLGWLNPGNRCKSYCFVFEGAQEPVMVAWAVDSDGDALDFGSKVTVTDNYGNEEYRNTVEITKSPIFITNLPQSWVDEAISNRGKPYTWQPDLRDAPDISCEMGIKNIEKGLIQDDRGDGVTVVVPDGGQYVRRTDRANGCYYMYFIADSSYIMPGDKNIEITFNVRGGRFNVTYESTSGYITRPGATPKRNEYGEYTVTINDADFNGNWGWHFRIETATNSDVYVKSVKVKRL